MANGTVPKVLMKRHVFPLNVVIICLKCSGYNNCVHLGNMYDQNEDCHFGDDEYLCSVAYNVCHSFMSLFDIYHQMFKLGFLEIEFIGKYTNVLCCCILKGERNFSLKIS